MRLKVEFQIRDYSVLYYSSAGDVWHELSRHFTYSGATSHLMSHFGDYAYKNNPFWKIKKWSDGWEVYIERLDRASVGGRNLQGGFLPMEVLKAHKTS